MEPLCDPLNDRFMKTVRAPPHRPLSRNLMWPNKNSVKPDWKLIKDHLSKEGRIEKEDLLRLVADCNKIMRNENNLLNLQDPLTVVGDIHGQFYDLLKILEVGGNPDSTKYLFLGDFVDRGSFSIEVLILLYAVKINYPETVYFLRGNHECRQMTSFFNFRDECKNKYDQEIYDIFMDSFDLMPLSCIVNGKFLALHGGISPDLKTVTFRKNCRKGIQNGTIIEFLRSEKQYTFLFQLEDIKKLDRFKEPPRQGLFCDMLWSDPVDNEDGICEHVYRQNDVRGCSYFYGNDAVRKFLESNMLISIIRAHEAQLDGYKMHRWNGGSDFPVVITIFSAPNYCDVYNNKGAVIKFENNTLNIQQFNYTQHPYLLPHFMDIFTWSIPFISEKISEMLFIILRQEEDGNDSDGDLDPHEIKTIESLTKNKDQVPAITTGDKPAIKEGSSKKVMRIILYLRNMIQIESGDVLRNKIKFISKMMKMQKILRQESEQIGKLKGQCPDNKIPKGLLLDSNAMSDAISSFNNAKKADQVNEMMPEDQLNKDFVSSNKNTLGTNNTGNNK